MQAPVATKLPEAAEPEKTYDRFFVTQLGGTAFNSYDGGDDGFEDCGPASAVMALSALGLVRPPTPDAAESQILTMRWAMHGPLAPSQGTTWDQLVTGLSSRGAAFVGHSTNLAAVDVALRKGNVVIIAGDPSNGGRYILADPFCRIGVITVLGDDILHFWSTNLPCGSVEVVRPTR